MPPKIPLITDEKRAERWERKREKKRKAKEEKVASAPAPAVKKRKKDPPKPFRRDWAAMKASLVYDEGGVGRTPDGAWAYFSAAGPASEKALPTGCAAERFRWMSLAFVEGEEGRGMLSSSDENSEGEGEREEGEDEEMDTASLGIYSNGMSNVEMKFIRFSLVIQAEKEHTSIITTTIPPKGRKHNLSEEKRVEIREKHKQRDEEKARKEANRKRKREEVEAGPRKHRPPKPCRTVRKLRTACAELGRMVEEAAEKEKVEEEEEEEGDNDDDEFIVSMVSELEKEKMQK